MDSRRNILKLIGASPVAFGSVKDAMAKIAANPIAETVGQLAAPGLATTLSVPRGGGLLNNLTDDLSKKLLDLNRIYQAEADVRLSVRQRVKIDPDLSCMKSTSMSWKVRKQIEREIEDRAADMNISAILWG